jgi:magnesium chelatase subunit D
VTDAPAAPDVEERWQRANLALACFALDPVGARRHLAACPRGAGPGPLPQGLRPRRPRKNRLSAASRHRRRCALRRHRPGRDAGGRHRDAHPGLLDRPGVLVLPMAERAKPRLAARLARALDDRKGLSLVALDEGAGPEERIPEALADRLAIHLDLSDIPLSDAPDLAGRHRRDCRSPPYPAPRHRSRQHLVSDLAQVAFRLGITSLRAPLQALALARASAASPVRRRWTSPTS